MPNVEDVTDVVGKFGFWQKSYFAIAIYTMTVVPLIIYPLTFMAPLVSFECVGYHLNITTEELRINETKDLCSTMVNGIKYSCVEWTYDKSVFTSTLIEKFDLVCHRAYYVSLTNSLYLTGKFVGTLVFGYLADRFGRRAVLLFLAVMSQVINLTLLFPINMVSFMVSRFLMGTISFQFLLIVLTAEIVAVEMRATLNSLIWIGYSLAYGGYSGIAYLLPNWFYIQVFISCTCLPFFLMFWFVPESPRWLLLNDHKERAEKVMVKAAKWNGMPTANITKDIEILTKMLKEKSTTEKDSIYNFLDFLSFRKSRTTTLILFSMWLSIGFLYYGISLNSEVFGGNLFLNFFLLGIIELPAHILAMFGCHYCTRRWVMIMTMSCAGIASLAISFLHNNLLFLRTTLVVVMKLCITICYTVIYLYSPETFPTGVRTFGMGVCSAFSSFSGVLSPFIKELSQTIGLENCMIILGVLSLLFAISSYFQPETKDIELPETLEEGEQLRKK